jgi:hypothetical protein
MLFYCDLADELLSIRPEALSIAVSDLVRAHRMGHHLAVINRASASWLMNNVDLSNSDGAMLTRISQEYAQTGDLQNKAKVFVRLTVDPAADLTVTGNAIHVSIEGLLKYRLLDPSILLSENRETDGKLYEFLLQNHCDLHDCSHVSFELQHGGGADLGMVFRELATDRKIVCAIVDSDKNIPTSNNQKLASLCRVKEAVAWPLCFPASPPCREVENMLPLNLVMALPSGQRNPANAIHLKISTEEITQRHSTANRYWYFFDIKEGLLATKFEAMGPEEKKWIGSKLQMASIDPGRQDISGYGDRVVRQAFDENRHLRELRKLTRQQTWRQMFSSFLEELVWVFVSTSKIVT